MKLPKGVTVYHNGQKYVGEAPDDRVKGVSGLTPKTDTKPKKEPLKPNTK